MRRRLLRGPARIIQRCNSLRPCQCVSIVTTVVAVTADAPAVDNSATTSRYMPTAAATATASSSNVGIVSSILIA